VAATQPAAWSHATYTTDELATPSPENRRVTLPYTKLLNSNIQVDQGAAVIVCSAQAAEALGVPRDRWVFVHATARGTDEWFLSERAELHRSPAIRAVRRGPPRARPAPTPARWARSTCTRAFRRRSSSPPPSSACRSTAS
jgi:acetyl-CoA C-acetyltransferase